MATRCDDPAIRAELGAMVLALDHRVGRAPAGELASAALALRRRADAGGLMPAATVARVVEAALARGECGPLIHGWLAILGEAVGCDRHDAQACDAFVAACSVRFAD